MFITGPRVIETVTREQVDLNALGGAMVHNKISGVAHFAAEDETDAMAITRKLLSYLPSSNSSPPPSVTPTDDPWRAEERLNTLVPTDPSESYDINQVVELIFDKDSFFPVHAHFALNVVPCRHTIGVEVFGRFQ